MTFHSFIQQEIWEVTRKTRIRSKKINLLENIPKELNTKTYLITVKEEEALN